MLGLGGDTTELLSHSTHQRKLPSLPHITSVGGEERRPDSVIPQYLTFEHLNLLVVTQADTETQLLKVALEILILLTKSNLVN